MTERFDFFCMDKGVMCSGGERKKIGKVDSAVETCQSKEECKTLRSVLLSSICSA